jgi:hypothetical protein
MLGPSTAPLFFPHHAHTPKHNTPQMQRLPSHKRLLLTVLQVVRTAAPCDAVRKVPESLQLTDSLQHYRASVSRRDIDFFARRARWAYYSITTRLLRRLPI